jgi:isoquinoline 1-oxidoreductase subunit alpha
MVTLNINGKSHSVEAAPDTPLLWAIREQLQMTGTKFGCGAGLCGACTIHVNGEAVRSCQTSLSEVAGKKITTIEGLSVKGDHPLGISAIGRDSCRASFGLPAIDQSIRCARRLL